MSELRKLKKYPNRRLYDFERHCYVCLDDVGALIAAKHDVQVIENETSTDITRETLMQVVMLLEERGGPLFSNSFLSTCDFPRLDSIILGLRPSPKE